MVSEDGEYSFEATGAMRVTGAYFHYRDMPEPLPDEDDGLATGVARLIFKGGLGLETSYEANLFFELSRMPAGALGGTFATAGSFEASTPYRARQLTWDYWESGAVRGSLGIDRFAFRIEAEPFAVTVGRFPINYSVTSIFTPNDLFAPFSPTAINTVYKPGVDALRLNASIDGLSGVEIIKVVGYRPDGEPSWGRSALLARTNTVIGGFEWAAFAGKVAERWLAAISLQGELGPFGLRAEGHVGFADEDGDGLLAEAGGAGAGRDEVHVRVAGGLELPIEWHNTFIAAEYAFFSDGSYGAGGYFERAGLLFPDDQPYLAKHYVGASLRGEIIPILTGAAMAIFNPEDLSGLTALSLAYSISDEADFAGGLLIPWGERPAPIASLPGIELRSEYGMWPITAFVETRFYF